MKFLQSVKSSWRNAFQKKSISYNSRTVFCDSPTDVCPLSPKEKHACRKFKNEYTSNIGNVFLSLKRVEQASEYAITEAFSFQEPSYPQGLCGPVTRLETVEQLQDHDEACKEGEMKYCLPQAA